MNRRLVEAADKGDVEKLRNLIKDYPLLLKAAALSGGGNPLHIACTGGHVDFVKEVLNLRPEFAYELNEDGFSPLHIASARGDIDIVKELLKLGSDLCLLQGREKRIPFHFAVVKGRIEVIRELLQACLDSFTEVTARGETCFHLAVKNNQFKALKVLCEQVITFDKEDTLNKKDEQGNTILHLAASRKQYEVVDLLLDKSFGYKGQLEMNSLNQNGLTPLDVLVSEGGDSEIEKRLTLAGAVTAAMSPQHSVIAIRDPSQNQSPGQEQRRDHRKSVYKELLDYFKFDRSKNCASEAQNALLVMAALIATATYTAVLSPPGGVWQDDFWPDSKNNATNEFSTMQPPRPHTAGKAVMASHHQVIYCIFCFLNSLGLVMSLRLMLILTPGLPLRPELTAAFFALAGTYAVSLAATTPTGDVFYVLLSVALIPISVFILPKVFTKFLIWMDKRLSLQSTRVSA